MVEKSEDRISPGRLVQSTAGRDSGKFYIILDQVDDTIVRVVDGEGRKVALPKKKNIKHLRVRPEVSEEIREKLLTGQRASDADVRKALQDIVAIRECE